MEESSAFIDERKAGMISVLQKNAKEMLSDLQAVVDEMHSGKYDKAEKSPKKMMEHIKELRTNFMSCAHPCRGTPQPFQFPAPSAPRPAAALLACAHSAACVPDYQVMSAPSALLATRRSLGCSLRTFRGSTRPTRSCSGTPTSGPTCMTSSSSPRAGWMVRTYSHPFAPGGVQAQPAAVDRARKPGAGGAPLGAGLYHHGLQV
mmetsp:Transcript_1771/g.4324  ORF Transcript_1771/g.4324 Transcript_1771/m.4324 type:complete len:204 (-) Transcript_1771:2443-3054(-)